MLVLLVYGVAAPQPPESGLELPTCPGITGIYFFSQSHPSFPQLGDLSSVFKNQTMAVFSYHSFLIHITGILHVFSFLGRAEGGCVPVHI